ncbi:MAG TPA: haloacid dehalogenase [Desulfobacteraceae bacterium]|nr:haloacid dehalogenase [Desulfobacteraceae bacterium]
MQAMIDPSSVAFDIDGVIADTMTLFLDIARDEYNIQNIRYEDIRTYMLEECLDIDKKIIHDIIVKLIDGNYTAVLKPIHGAPDVIGRIGEHYSPVLFVTARPHLGPIHQWMTQELPLEPQAIDIIATGSFEAKADILKSRGISYFVEDRLDTCFLLKDAGITPILFKQPWNRHQHPFIEVSTWQELESLIKL